MEKTNQTTAKPRVKVSTYHAVTVDGTDVQVTKFLEYVQDVWLQKYSTLFDISDNLWDNGHDTFKFTTHSGKTNLIKYVQMLSKQFPDMFLMYDFYTGEEEPDFIQETYWLYKGEINNKKENLLIDNKKEG